MNSFPSQDVERIAGEFARGRISRRAALQRLALLGMGAAAAGPLISACNRTPGPAAVADTIYRGGPVLTMVDDRRQVEAVAIAGGRILAVGSEQDVMATRGDATMVVDLAGRTLMPSFIDSHGHFMNALQVVNWANVQGVPAGPISRVADFAPVLQEHVRRLGLKPGDWIIGYGYDRSNLAESRELTVDDLDPLFPDNPVMLIHSSNHGAVLNSAGFARSATTTAPRRRPAA